MSRLEPLEFDGLPADLKAFAEQTVVQMGFRPNDLLIMARNPALTKALGELVNVIYSPAAISIELKTMIALIGSSVAGCRYCQSHNTHGAVKLGINKEKIAAIWEYSESPLFSEAERAALDVSRAAAMTPNEVTDKMFEKLKKHYSEEQIIEIVSVISLFGFLNKWNATFNTDLEEEPRIASQL